MNYRSIFAQLGWLAGILGSAMLLPLVLGGIYGDSKAMMVFGGLAGALLLICVFLRLKLGEKSQNPLGRKEAVLVVVGGWLLAGVISAVPFYALGAVDRVSAALFEAVSGLTTTGATVIDQVEALGRPIQLWRFLLHWLGGIGIVVLFVAIFPSIGVGGRLLVRQDALAQVGDGPKPKLRQSVLTLWWVYASLTLCCVVMLKLTGFSWFDALCHGFSTLSTGGFSTRNGGISDFHNPAAEWVLCVFMFLAGVNFALLARLPTGKLRRGFGRSEFLVYVLLCGGVIFMIFGALVRPGQELMETLRESVFQTMTIISTTGYATADYNRYPEALRWLFLFLIIVGGSTGSTAGGIKIGRMLALLKMLGRELQVAVRPREVVPVKIGSRPLPEEALNSIMVFVGSFFLVFFLGTMVMVLSGYDILSASSAVLGCLSNLGPGLGDLGPMDSYGKVPSFAQGVLCLVMVAGRLEIVVLLAPLARRFWLR